MIFVTSLSPKHSNFENQQEAAKSWQRIGYTHSLNSQKEIDLIENDYFGVNFVRTDKTLEILYNRPLVNINAILDFAIDMNQDLFLINSDIIVKDLPPLHTDGISIFSRYDYTDHFGEGKLFKAGYDGFYIPKRFLNVFPITVYALGACYWDHAFPLRYIEKNIPVYWPQGKYLFHKLHKTQYSIEEWIWLAEYFRFEFKLPKTLNAGEIATQSLQKIHQKAIKTV